MARQEEQEEIEVVFCGGRPRSFRWRDRQYTIRTVLERWTDTGRWWEGERVKVFLRVAGTGGTLWEIYFDTATSTWHLYKIYD